MEDEELVGDDEGGAGDEMVGDVGKLDRYNELSFPPKVNRPKLAGMTETRRNGLKFFPRWNKGVSRSGLHTSTRFSGRFSRNGTVYITLILIHCLRCHFLF